jgi:hypothetical protein
MDLSNILPEHRSSIFWAEDWVPSKSDIDFIGNVYQHIIRDSRFSKFILNRISYLEDTWTLEFSLTGTNPIRRSSWVCMHLFHNYDAIISESAVGISSYSIQSFNTLRMGKDMYNMYTYLILEDAIDKLFEELEKRHVIISASRL